MIWQRSVVAKEKEGNIVIDPSSVPVSLSWYNRTSSQQDATINLTIGDTTVNLFPNIFKLFKAGKVSTSESLSIELTANPGVSGFLLVITYPNTLQTCI